VAGIRLLQQERSLDIVSEGKVSIAIHGALGRMGFRLIQLIADDPALKLAGALVRDGHPRLGEDAGTAVGVSPMGVALGASVPAGAAVDVMVDFSAPAAAVAIGAWCREQGVPLVVGTTGLEAAHRRELEAASERIPLLIAPNMSRAVNLLMKLVGEAARVLGSAADIEIIERHHRTKKDAPSGTAIRLGEMAGRGAAAARLIPGRPGQAGVRQPGEIGIHALRVADCPGDHTVVFSLLGETLELSHRALNRDGFVRGALEAAKFLAGKPAGLYSMEDVLA
jgi:4-hydroxy-tetrahydrodipicolinate reductase